MEVGHHLQMGKGGVFEISNTSSTRIESMCWDIRTADRRVDRLGGTPRAGEERGAGEGGPAVVRLLEGISVSPPRSQATHRTAARGGAGGSLTGQDRLEDRRIFWK